MDYGGSQKEFGVAKVELVGKENREYFDEVLVKHSEWGASFSRFEDLKVGKKLGEGGRGEIFEATSQGYKIGRLVAEVFKKNVFFKIWSNNGPPSSDVSSGFKKQL